MSKLKSLTENFEKAVSRLQEVLNIKEKNKIIRDSAIKRFEIAFDVAWKVIKTFLEEKKGTVCHSPKDCFRQAYEQNIVEYDDFWLEMTDYRNNTAHTYKEELADEVYAILPKVLSFFEKLLTVVKN